MPEQPIFEFVILIVVAFASRYRLSDDYSDCVRRIVDALAECIALFLDAPTALAVKPELAAHKVA